MPDAGTTVDAPTDAGLAGQIDALISTMGDQAATLATDQEAGAGVVAGAGAEGSGARALDPNDVASLADQIDSLVSEVEGASSASGVDEPLSSGASSTAPASSTARPDASPPGPGTEVRESEATAESIVAGLEEALASELAGAAAGPAVSASAGSDGVQSNAPVPTEAATDPAEVGDADGGAAHQPSVQLDLSGLDAQLAAQAAPEVDPPTVRASAPVAPVLPVTHAAGDPADPRECVSGEQRAAVAEVQTARIEDEATKATLVSRLAEAAGAAATAAMPAARRLAGLSASAYEKSPKLARDTLGWIGLVTVFFACCMWVVVLFFRKIEAPEAYDVPSSVLEPGEPTPQPRPRPRAADAHAAPEASHAQEKPANDHGGGDQAGGGGEHR